MKDDAHKQRLWTGDFTLMLAIAFCAFVSCQALNNGTPLYITRIGGSTGFAGALILDFSIAAAIARLFAGRIIDRTGRKCIMVVGALLLIAGSALAIPLPGFYPQIVLRALQGIGFACVTTASATAAADVLPCERLGEGIGYYALGQSLGMAFGPAFGIFLCSLVFTESLFVGVAGAGAVLLILVMCCNYEKHVERLPETSEYRVLEERRRRLAEEADSGDIEAVIEEVEDADRYRGLAALFEKRALVGALPMVVICLGFAIPVSYTALYAQSLGLSNAGMFFFVGAIAMTASRFFWWPPTRHHATARSLPVDELVRYRDVSRHGVRACRMDALCRRVLLRPVYGFRVSAAQLDGGQEHAARALGCGQCRVSPRQ